MTITIVSDGILRSFREHQDPKHCSIELINKRNKLWIVITRTGQKDKSKILHKLGGGFDE